MQARSRDRVKPRLPYPPASSVGYHIHLEDLRKSHLASRKLMSFSRFGKIGVYQLAMSDCSRFPQLLQLPAGIAPIICIVGGSGLIEGSVSEQSTGRQLIKASLINLPIIYICLFLLTANSARENGSLRSGKTMIILALRVALPLLGFRIFFRLLAYFLTILTFSPASVHLLVRALRILEQILIVIA